MIISRKVGYTAGLHFPNTNNQFNARNTNILQSSEYLGCLSDFCNFMEFKGSLRWTQHAVTKPHLESHESTPVLILILTKYFNQRKLISFTNTVL
jgi:hypothetical protein